MRRMDEHGAIRAPTPPRGDQTVDGELTIWTLCRQDSPLIRAVLVAFTDAVELEIYCGDVPRKRFRFLRDAIARRYAERLRAKLRGKGFNERSDRVS
jgi:hypothetical protein